MFQAWAREMDRLVAEVREATMGTSILAAFPNISELILPVAS
jgi:hypothetical protein